MKKVFICVLLLLICSSVYGENDAYNTDLHGCDEKMNILNTIKASVKHIMEDEINALYAVSTNLMMYCEKESEERLFLKFDTTADSLVSLDGRYRIVFDASYSHILDQLSNTFDLCYVSVHDGKVEFRKFCKLKTEKGQPEYYDYCLIYSKDRLHSSWECDLISSDNSFGNWYLSLIPYE